MLVIVSDLHLSDGSTANNFNPEAFGILAGEIRTMAQQRGAQEVELVLLGDVFDLVRTDYWHVNVPAGERPWGGRPDRVTAMNPAPAIEKQYGAVLERIIRTDAAHPRYGFGRFLNDLVAHFTEQGKPFHVHYVIGNHDRVLHNFPSMQRQIGAAYPAIGSFAAAYVSEAYATVARHGHEWDTNCHGYDFQRQVLKPAKKAGRFDAEAYRVQAIGEVVTAELMSGLVHHARVAGGDSQLIARLKDVNNLRPVLDVFEWLDWFGGARTGEQQRVLHAALAASLDGVLNCSFARLWDKLKTDIIVSGDLVDRLALARSVLLGGNFGEFRRKAGALELLQKAFSVLSQGDPFRDGAKSEYEAKDGLPAWTQHVVYGHTHRARRDYFSGQVDGHVRMYVNSGTFLPLISRVADGRGFATELQMTMVFAYAEAEDSDTKRGGPSLDIWNGTRRKQYASLEE
jgi:UDP-2,3-diacylglucosamine pyrophosphatase LpxH